MDIEEVAEHTPEKIITVAIDPTTGVTAADSAALASRASKEGIMLAPGNIFRPQMQPSPWLRFNVAYALDPRLERFLGARLGLLHNDSPLNLIK